MGGRGRTRVLNGYTTRASCVPVHVCRSVVCVCVLGPSAGGSRARFTIRYNGRVSVSSTKEIRPGVDVDDDDRDVAVFSVNAYRFRLRRRHGRLTTKLITADDVTAVVRPGVRDVRYSAIRTIVYPGSSYIPTVYQ